MRERDTIKKEFENFSGSCKIEVRARPLAFVQGIMPFDHLYIIFTKSDGFEYIFRAGPENGILVADSIGTLYQKDHDDWWPGAPSITVLDGEDSCSKWELMIKESNLINGKKMKYWSWKPPLTGAFYNSNSYVRTVLKNCSIPELKPFGADAPGWKFDIK